MREREIDNLFRKKLETHGAAAPESAWNRVEANIQSDKVTWRFYLGIAASILLIGIISLIIFLPDRKTPEMTAQKENEISQPLFSDENTDAKVATSEIGEEAQIIDKSQSESAPVKEESNKKRTRENQTVKPANSQLIAENSQVQSTETSKTSDDPGEELQIGKLNSLAGVQTEPLIQPVALNVDPISVEKPVFETETSDRGINLQKVIDLAKEIKNDNKGWSALRDAKNDLLAFGRKKNNENPEEIED